MAKVFLRAKMEQYEPRADNGAAEQLGFFGLARIVSQYPRIIGFKRKPYNVRFWNRPPEIPYQT